MAEKQIISREASDKGGKGFRLQKLRAVELVLEALEKSREAHILSAIEHKEDVFISVASEEQDSDYLEEDKNYDPESNFSLNSGIVRNTLVGFVDLWISDDMDKNVYFGFYATNGYTKERETETVKLEEIALPDTPLLESLIKRDLNQSVVKCLRKYILFEYRNQYPDDKKTGNLRTLEKWGEKDWKFFLERIDWKFGEDDHLQLEEKLIEKIKDCPHYNCRDHKGKEEIILSRLIDQLDKKQNLGGLHKFISSAHVRNAFLEVARTDIPVGNEDPVGELWNSLPAPSDKRNLQEKVLSVCSDYTKRELDRLLRRLCAAKVENRTYGRNKDFLSMRYRVFDKCEAELDKMIEAHGEETITREIVSSWIDSLKRTATAHIDDLASSYSYSLSSEAILEGIILDLFDECYLAFNNEQQPAA